MNQKNMCPRFEKALMLLNHRWNTLLIYQLLDGPQRYSTIKNQLSISSRVLTERLKELESEEIVLRTVIPSTPVVIEYELTEKGYAITPVLKAIEEWSSKWITIAEE
ncbi:MarR family transcriptional regulator [Lysinibacillus sphaericus]|uniref:HTH-type transcriptional regulator YodB n=1 Tax=Lysinibacillus sphaericus TaxID=1421 RepID=A0A2S5D491_LYSSH|nr:helix-turn-helix domain-containing protein [Lysinibacillus sphaericus]OEC02766.1 MarR family transcriptional regulator [Lysinibacillus sphaericus]POZ57896.1 HTH-type transcriptional regulator YodB [Lysinibacillus sphaericus]